MLLGGPRRKMRIFVWAQNWIPIVPVNSLVLKHCIPKVSLRSIDLFPSFGGVEAIHGQNRHFRAGDFLNEEIGVNFMVKINMHNSIKSMKLMWMFVLRSDNFPMPRRSWKFTQW